MMSDTDRKKYSYLFVYGTLLRNVESPMHIVLAKQAEFVGEGRFNGMLYNVGSYPAAVRTDNAENMVYGEVYLMREPRKALALLDEYEGCNLETPLFRREKASVLLSYGEEVEAWIYLYNHSTEGLERIKSGSYLEYCNAPS